MKAISNSDTSLALQCIENSKRMVEKNTFMSQEQDRENMFLQDDRSHYEERWRMHSHDIRMTSEQQQIMVTLKVMNISEGFDLLRAFAEHSDGHFRLDFWRELQDFKKMRPGTQEFANSVRRGGN